MSDRRSRVAHVEDVDDEGNVIEGTDRYAESVYAHSVVSPSKEREIPNTGRTRKERTRRGSISPGTSGLTDSDSTLHPQAESFRSRDHERRLSRDKKAMVPSGVRPPVKHAKTTPIVPKEASYYGVTPPTANPMPPPRQRAHSGRPPSVHNNSRPPAANTRWYQNQGPPPQQPLGSYPMPSWGASPYPMPPPSPSPMVSQSPQDYFSRPLESRFGTSGPRPQSSIGFRPPPRPIGFDDYEPDEMVVRGSSGRRASRHEDLRGSMAPPPRPASARPVSLAIRPPPGTPARRMAAFDDEDYRGDSDLFRDISPRTQGPYEQRVQPIPIRSKSRARRPSSIYDVGNYRTEVAVARGGRRSSYYDQDSPPGSYEDKLNQASRYQDEVTGGNPGTGMQLTAERLRKASRHGGSGSSTRSSESRDESDFRRSATTRTTRSSAAGEEDMTIRVKGNAVLEVGGARLRCQDGAEISVPRGQTATGFRTTSDQSSYLGHEDRRSRMERPAARHRASSQAASLSRSIPRYDASPGYYGESPYDPVPPPYPAYPSVFPSRPREDGYF